MKTINERLAALRSQMNLHGLDAYIVPSSDPHQSEYVAERWQSRAWISGFTGSMGYVVVTPEHAGVWTDSRYFLQCETEIKNTHFVLHKQGVQGAPEHLDWLHENVPLSKKIGCDGSLFSVEQIRGMKRIFAKNFQWCKIFLRINFYAHHFQWMNNPFHWAFGERFVTN